MTNVANTPSEDSYRLQTESFTAPLILQRELLNDKNVLEYFYESPFFDVNSANQRRRKGHRVADEGEGVEYVYVLSNDAGKGKVIQQVGYPFNVQNQFGVHVICRVHKRNNVQIPERVYYCIAGTIYQAPSLQHVLLYRLQKAAMLLDQLVQKVDDLKHWNVLSSYNWKAEIDPLAVLASVNETNKGDVFDDDFISSSDEETEKDETMLQPNKMNIHAPAHDTAAASQREYFEVPSILGTDAPSTPLSFRGVRNQTSVLYNFPATHVSSVMQNEYEQLYKASQRMANIFLSEATSRPKVEAARRDVFVKCHQALDDLEGVLLNSFRSSRIPEEPHTIFGCNPPQI